MKTFRFLLGVLPMLAGCSQLSTRVAPQVDLSHQSHIYVEHLLTNERGIDQIIARELRKRGYDAIAGSQQQMPDNAQLVIVYNDRWDFDFTYYMIELDLSVNTARTENLLATARYFQPSVTGHSALDMVDKVL